MNAFLKKHFILLMMVSTAYNAAAQQEHDCERNCLYRHIVFEESDKYIKRGIEIADTFSYYYRPDFHCRYLDEDYFLCKILSIQNTASTDSFPQVAGLWGNDNVLILNIEAQIIEFYKSREDPFIHAFWGEELFREEYLGIHNHGLLDYISHIDSCANDTTLKVIRISLLVRKNEIHDISEYMKNGTPILCNNNTQIDKTSIYSDIYYSQSNYDVSELFSLKEWRDFLHQRMDNVVKTFRNNKAGN